MGKSELTKPERRAILDYVLARCIYDKVPYGTFTQAGAIFNVSDRTIRRIWKQGKQYSQNVTTHTNVSIKKG